MHGSLNTKTENMHFMLVACVANHMTYSGTLYFWYIVKHAH
jgi:hypothetical protein